MLTFKCSWPQHIKLSHLVTYSHFNVPSGLTRYVFCNNTPAKCFYFTVYMYKLKVTPQAMKYSYHKHGKYH